LITDLALYNYVLTGYQAFVASADEFYGPITTIRANGRISKRIEWTAFQLKESDWVTVRRVKEILLVWSLTILHVAIVN